VHDWYGGCIEATFRHSSDLGRFAVFLRGEDARRSGTLLPATISEGVSRLASLSLTPYSNAWGYPTNPFQKNYINLLNIIIRYVKKENLLKETP